MPKTMNAVDGDVLRCIEEGENPDYLRRQLITYIGNKRKLLNNIESLIIDVKIRLGKSSLRTLDLFSGSGVVSRLLKSHSCYVVSNDIEEYSEVIGKCFLSNKSEVDL